MSQDLQARFALAAYQQIRQASSKQSRAHLKGMLEALIFAAPSPLSVRELARISHAPRAEVQGLLAELARDHADSGIGLHEIRGGYTFLTHPRYAAEVRIVTGKKPVRMSRAQLETLAIIAYRQPVTRPEIDEVRGVDSGPVLRTLVDRELIRVLGKKEEPGRPLLYGTTESFLTLLGLSSLADLPTLREFTELTDDSRETYERRLGEAAPLGAFELEEPDGPSHEGEGASIDEADGDAPAGEAEDSDEELDDVEDDEDDDLDEDEEDDEDIQDDGDEDELDELGEDDEADDIDDDELDDDEDDDWDDEDDEDDDD